MYAFKICTTRQMARIKTADGISLGNYNSNCLLKIYFKKLYRSFKEVIIFYYNVYVVRSDCHCEVKKGSLIVGATF